MLKADSKNVYSLFTGGGSEYVFNFLNIEGSATADANAYTAVLEDTKGHNIADSTRVHLADSSNQMSYKYVDIPNADDPLGVYDPNSIENGKKFTFSVEAFNRINENDTKLFGKWAVEIFAKGDSVYANGWIPWDRLKKMPNFTITKGG